MRRHRGFPRPWAVRPKNGSGLVMMKAVRER
jgi:hypothetical protein